ncbi:hypothetical protein [Flavihumibacter sp. UBA7668]|uniref:hypothetical protein n=1 Tax=Flavihumibacter sp. UBA7668 TaxID=1946542 RepID=UPI0025BBC20D|nr:hypothetical protein [Flavihumibacter sp. UBA7668]
MTPDKNIVSELKVLAGQQQTVPYQVPIGYFDSFPERMLELVKSVSGKAAIQTEDGIKVGEEFTFLEEITTLSPLLAGLSKKMPFTVPNGYFDQIEPATVKTEHIATEDAEIETGSILLLVNRKGPYEVPIGYFEQFPGKMVQKIGQVETGSGAKVIFMGKSWLRYAAAAVVAGVLAIAGWFYFQPASENPGMTPAFAKQLETEMQQISDEAILEFTNPTSSIYYGTAANQTDELSVDDVHDLLGDVSDEALQKYLQEFNGKSTSNMN